MGFETLKFNPKDEKYKKVADLPKEEQKKYEDTLEGDGFITKEAFKEDVENIIKSNKHNYKSVIKMLFGRKLSKQDFAQMDANKINDELNKDK